MAILVTGAAGFIGSAVSLALALRGETVIGVDNLNAYYSPALKRARLDRLTGKTNFRFVKADVSDFDAMTAALSGTGVTSIIHLAAQAGVRHSITNPFAYSRSNLAGHLAILELARKREVRHLVYASSSSVYGANKKAPFAEDDRTDAPVSLYGATKKADEVMSQAYATLYGLAQTGLRFFTVYGPWGRPDMAYWIFTDKIARGEPIDVFNEGAMARDFTYIDDIISGVLAAHDRPPGEADGRHRIFNLGNDQPQELAVLIDLIEAALGKTADRRLKPMQQGDVERTWANIDKARAILGYAPRTSLADGVAAFVKWRQETPIRL